MTYRYRGQDVDELAVKRELERRRLARAEIRRREQVRTRLKVTGRRPADETPALHPGDSPQVCAERLIAASMEAGKLWEDQRPRRRAAA